ncbi:hypothetical protein [Roseovarius sp. M141]|uniref:hypothetical protein n=1 Tax=Roseovarius sp. M141 TaxID=2583806 RepID=UPI0020CEDADE|nr:hypothetical protein [Roseovarius sp. M141]
MPTSTPTPKKAQSTKATLSATQQTKPSAPRKAKAKPQTNPRQIFNDFASI